jgi:DNA-binding Lrp family transcriptional regulator
VGEGAEAMNAPELDGKAHRILAAIRHKTRPYTEADIAMATQLSKGTVRKRLDHLVRAGLIRETWPTPFRGPFYEIEEG